MSKFFAGIGSRQTPPEILVQMTGISEILTQELGLSLRSGGADGADYAFEVGASSKEIYIPWKGYNNRNDPEDIIAGSSQAHEDIASQFHPAWDRCTSGARKLHARNVAILLGMSGKDPAVLFTVCWTKDGKASGGTGQALRMCEYLYIPVFNLFFDTAVDELEKYLKELGEI